MDMDQLAFGKANISGRMISISRQFQNYLDITYQTYRLGGMQHAFVTIVCRNPGIPQRELLRWFPLDQSNVTRNLLTLEKLGYIRREKLASDKRNWLLYPTGKALDIYDEVVAIYDDAMARMLDGIGGDDLECFSRVLDAIEANLAALNDPQR